ncbi:MAG: VOC family protein [Myxococcota bacterium]
MLPDVIQTFDHVVVAVRDLVTSSERTAALLGREASWRGVHPGAGTANTLYRLDNGTLELLARDGEGPIGDAVSAFLDTRGEGMLALAFGSDDVAADVAALRERGWSPPDPRLGEGRGVARADGVPGVRRWTNALLPTDVTRGLQLMLIKYHSPADALPLAAPGGSPDAALGAFDHAVVISQDLEASASIYGGALGLRLALDRSFEARELRILFFRVGGVTVEVAGPLAGGDAAAPDRFGGLAYRVGDIDAARLRIHEAGIEVTEVRAGHKPGTRVSTVRGGICGVPTLLIQPAPAG